MTDKNLSPSPANTSVSVDREYTFGSDVAIVEKPFRIVHVTIPVALDSCTLTPKYTLPGESDLVTLDFDQEGRSYPTATFTGPLSATFVVPPGAEFQMVSSVAQTEIWAATAS